VTNARTTPMVVVAMLMAPGGLGFMAIPQDWERSYAVETLRTLGGTNSRGNGVSDWGLVSGFSNMEGDTASRATIWFGGRPINLGTLGGASSSVGWSGQSDTALVVGIAQTRERQTRSDGWSCRQFFPGSQRDTYECVGFVWEWGRMRALATLGGRNGFAASANNRRQIVGWTETKDADATCTNPEDRGFTAVWWDLNRGTAARLAPYGADTASAATAISDRGHVVGISGDCDQAVGRRSARHAVMWHRGETVDLGNVGNDSWNTPAAISSNGDIVVGFANAPGATAESPRLRAWLWTLRDDIACSKLTGTDICDLGTLDAAGTAEAWGVNARGQVVGTSCAPSGSCRAFLWQNGEMQDLNRFKGSYPLHLENAMSISESGRIVGRARVSGSAFEEFAATPKGKP
jgi:probable HAF family extracellular repeat protein